LKGQKDLRQGFIGVIESPILLADSEVLAVDTAQCAAGKKDGSGAGANDERGLFARMDDRIGQSHRRALPAVTDVVSAVNPTTARAQFAMGENLRQAVREIA